MIPPQWIPALAAGFLTAAIVARPAQSAVLRVPSEYPTIQAGIDAAAPGDSVLVAAGTFTGAGNKNLDFAKDIVVVSEAGPGATIIDCEDAGRGVHCRIGESTTMFKGFTVRNGWPNAPGGALLLDGASLTIVNCSFEDNAAGGWGGAIACFGANVVVTNCSFVGNGAYGYGGALYVHSSTASISESVFRSNGAPYGGGGVGAEQSSLTIDRSVFHSNACQTKLGAGGAVMAFEQSTVILTGCTFVRNRHTAVSGHMLLSPMQVRNCTFYGNSGANQPPTSNSLGGTALITNCILANGMDGPAVAGGPCTATCTDVFGNPGGDWVGPLSGQNGVNGNISLDPQFCDPLNDDFTLSESSPCAPAHSGACGLIGAHDVACGVSAVEPTTWGRVKAILRDGSERGAKRERQEKSKGSAPAPN
jgi:hypothetical protein